MLTAFASWRLGLCRGRSTGTRGLPCRGESRRSESVSEKVFVVDGMTCDHCVRAVTDAVGGLVGVSDVRVDLSSGRVTVSGDQIIDEQVGAAVAEAGYAVRT